MAALVTGRHREFVLGDLEEMYARRRRAGGRLGTLAYLSWGLRSAPRAWASRLCAGLGGDVRAALRQLRSSPRVHVGAGVVLAVGLGAAAVAWGIDHGTFGRGLPVSEPDRMVAIRMVEARRPEVDLGFSVRDLEVLRDRAPGLDDAGLWSWATATVDDDEAAPQRVEALRVSPSMFDLLELTPLHGRVMWDSDARPGAPPTVVLGHRFWSRRYGSDPGIVGRAVQIDGRAANVAGVLAPGERFASEDLWIPAGIDGNPTARDHDLLARLAPGVTPEDLTSALAGFGERLQAGRDVPSRDVALRAVGFAESFRVDHDSRYMSVVSWSGALLFAMALANVASLFIVGARTRSRELAVRRALGAGRLRLVRQLAVEAAIPAVLGLLGATALAATALDGYERLQELYAGGPIVSWRAYELEPAHLGVLLAGALSSTVFVSILAAGRELARDDGTALRSGRRATSRFRPGQALVAVEVALGGALLLLSSLMIRSALNLQTVDWGFATGTVMTGHVILDEPGYPAPEDRLRFWRALEDELAAIPGVESATLATQLPMIRYAGRWGARRAVEIEGQDPGAAGTAASAPGAGSDGLPHHYVDAVTPTFFGTFESSLVAGRGFVPSDRVGSEPVAVVNTPFARRYFLAGDPLGRRVRVWRGDEPGPWRTIVGVAPHLWMDTDENEDPEGVYVPVAQTAPPEASLAIRVRGDPGDYAGALRDAVARLDADLPVDDVRSMPRLIGYRTRSYRVFGFPFIIVGVAALVLVVTGMYSVVSYIASLRTAEFGIRAALGATLPELVMRSVLSGLGAVAAGTPGAVVAGLALTRGFTRFMFEVDPWSPAVVAASLTVLALCSLVASLVPALRAGRSLDLVEVLSTE